MESRIPAVIAAVTGGIACGKSEVGRIFKEAGFALIDADDICHELLRNDVGVIEKVRLRFGDEVAGGDGIDRRKLGGVVFRDPSARKDLNEILHPPARCQWRGWVSRRRAEGRNAAVEIPLLYEIEEVELWDAVVVVSSEMPIALERLEKRGLNRKDAILRMEAQMPNEEKQRRADYVIENNGTIEKLRACTMETICKLMQERGVG